MGSHDMSEEKRRYNVAVATMPAWVKDLPTRLRNCMVDTFVSENFPSWDMQVIRAYGEAAWLRTPNLGRKGVETLRIAIGEFDIPPEDISRRIRDLEIRVAALEAQR
jgi:hypothetical protein